MSSIAKKSNIDTDSDSFAVSRFNNRLPIPRWSRWQDNREGGKLIIVVCLFDYSQERTRRHARQIEVLDVDMESTYEMEFDVFLLWINKRIVTRFEQPVFL